MNHAMTITTWSPGSGTGNTVGPEMNPNLRISAPWTEPIEKTDALITETYRDWARVAETPEKLEYGARAARLMCPGSGGIFYIIDATKRQQITTFEIPDWIQISVLAARQKQLFDRLDTLRNKVQCYNESDDIDWPTDQACEDAKKFIRHLPLYEIHVPEIYFAHDGEVNFLWEETDIGLEVDLGFYGDGTYSYFATDGSGNKLKKDDVDVEQELPGDLADMLKV